MRGNQIYIKEHPLIGGSRTFKTGETQTFLKLALLMYMFDSPDKNLFNAKHRWCHQYSTDILMDDLQPQAFIMLMCKYMVLLISYKQNAASGYYTNSIKIGYVYKIILIVFNM